MSPLCAGQQQATSFVRLAKVAHWGALSPEGYLALGRK
jgi:hypothetical protein